MITTVLFTVGWAISVGLLVAVFLTYRDCKKVLGNANKSAFYDDLDARISRLQREIEEKMPEVDRLRAEKQSAEMDAEAARRQKLEEERELETTRAEILRLRDQILQLQPEQEELRKTREALDRTRLELSDGQKTLADQMVRLGTAQAEAASALVRRDEALKDLQSCEDRLPHLKAETAALEVKERSLQSSCSALKEECDAIRASADAAQDVVRDLEGRRRELEFMIERLTASLRGLEEDCQSRRAEVESQRQQLNQLQKALEAKAAEEQNLQRSLHRLGGEVEDMERKHANAKEQFDELTEAVKALKSSTAKLRAEESGLRGEIESEKAQLEGLKKSRGTLEKVVESLSEAASQYGVHAKVSASDALEDIKQPIQFGFAGKTRGPVPTEEQLLKDLPGRLSSAGLSFHPRVLAAFHTSLKTSDYNQLTVLAGVSGTGKSALPRAYAAAMGIHSLVVPVQPGWAGPQDLLGFFNYLERKYKATELSRYIAHFSQYAKQDLEGVEFKEAGDRSGELLLVLLDEMNLARVEYYFSEFLSRLEMRSSIDPKNEEQRRKVAIPLDTGPLKETTRRLVLYPDTNILFVGTMNEDESTQTLSEKVVDRANVLRFGSPHLSSFGQSRRTSSAVASTESALGRGEWEKWCSPKRAGMSVAARLKGFEDALPRLSQVMDDLGRPFGHRVYEAIRLYILAYPSFQANEEEKAGRIALADQMEQKVLPKLRGVDTSERAKDLSTLKKLIAELDDPLLSASFAKAQDRPTFEWQGVKRDESGG